MERKQQRIDDRELERNAFSAVTSLLGRDSYFKSFALNRIVDQAAQCENVTEEFWV